MAWEMEHGRETGMLQQCQDDFRQGLLSPPFLSSPSMHGRNERVNVSSGKV